MRLFGKPKPGIVVIGGGACAASAVGTLREQGYDGKVTVVSDEAEYPYERPLLSKKYLLDNDSGSTGIHTRQPGWYQENEIELLFDTRVRRIDPKARRVQLAGGRDLPYSRLLIATGGRARRLPGPRSDRLLYLRTRADAQHLGEQLKAGQHLVILGAGFIGCEVAAAARQRGLRVTLIDMRAGPLNRDLGDRLGGVLAEIHRDNGAELRTGERIRTVTETPAGLVVETDKSRLDCDVVLAALGMQPNSDPFADTGLEIADGLVVDEYGRTNADDVFAAGDVASQYNPTFGRRLRVEHFDNAVKAGASAATNMIGKPAPLVDPLWFWTDQYGHNIQAVGQLGRGCTEVVRGEVDELRFSVFYLRDGLVRAVLALNRPRDVLHGRKLVLNEIPVSAEVLADPGTDLAALLRAHRPPR
ncbi:MULTISPECIES: NAD(P)/FAD-dependent oxidoreductase [unclassified Crossiella]|uniref:NAD(P)/FAD-dependent oxidoreductase n=1 Tax=unclassified Crossiella TaxID=2620835 RepID=UPI00200053F6|nr:MULTISPECIES: FAD-dependent oxidoreductase [unclassified Crossiella]MCK2239040.1 FAD-dependent oxidoreductase [Crossiella sp. S99.2]MCK2251391.1 FAD-dependent oxidoreductase [Crossiella sp. S99.1]